LGNVRTEQIKRVAKELIKRFPDKFSGNFDENKRVVSTLIQGATTKVRNQIAGYITNVCRPATPTTSLSDEDSEGEESD